MHWGGVGKDKKKGDGSLVRLGTMRYGNSAWVRGARTPGIGSNVSIIISLPSLLFLLSTSFLHLLIVHGSYS